MANNWAIVVGINHYHFLPKASLKFAAADALAMRKFLCEEGGFDSNKVTLCGNAEVFSKQATRSILRDILLNHCRDASNADNLWFFFSGHGFAGEHHEDYLITVDGNPGDLKETAISISFVSDCLRKSKAKNIVLVLDMCRDVILDMEKKSIIELNRSMQKGMITIYSCTRGQSSYEISDLKQGAFTYAFLEGLRKKTILQDLEHYLESRIPELHRSVGKPQRVQVPLVLPHPGWKYTTPILTTLVPEIAELEKQAIDAESDGNVQNALGLWEKVNLSASNVDDRQRALKRIQDLQARLNPLVVTTTQAPAPRGIPKTPVAEPVKPKQKPIDRPIDRPTFTRRKMLYIGLGSMGTVGAIAVGMNSRPPTVVSVSSPSVVPISSPLQFTFNSVKLNSKGEIIDRISGKATYFSEDLGNGVMLDMVKIPAGTFKMGASQGEEGASQYEFPQHDVKVSEFWMGRFAVTQAQWKAIALLPKVKIDLKSDPSNFKGEKLPVEQVSWNEAKEFCDRLSKKTGKIFDLPTEAQWEYACRAGTTTPFHFGETITTDMANFAGNYTTYAEASKGTYRQKTIEVGSFDPNAFGLYNMHGNVWEWCLDPWHENYEGAPKDDRVWDASNDSGSKILRGGSWFVIPQYCRSAYRVRDTVDPRISYDGFRVVYSSARILS